MEHDRPVLNQINLVVRDMDAMVGFYERLGIEIAPTIEPWDRHHRTLSTPAGLDFDLDSRAFAGVWDPGWPAERTGPVLGFRLASPEAVDATYAALVDAGHTGEQAPYDAFFGARYAVVRDPDGNAVGLMSPPDPARASMPPAPPES